MEICYSIYTYICVCVCVCVSWWSLQDAVAPGSRPVHFHCHGQSLSRRPHTAHTHTHIHTLFVSNIRVSYAVTPTCYSLCFHIHTEWKTSTSYKKMCRASSCLCSDISTSGLNYILSDPGHN